MGYRSLPPPDRKFKSDHRKHFFFLRFRDDPIDHIAEEKRHKQAERRLSRFRLFPPERQDHKPRLDRSPNPSDSPSSSENLQDDVGQETLTAEGRPYFNKARQYNMDNPFAPGGSSLSKAAMPARQPRPALPPSRPYFKKDCHGVDSEPSRSFPRSKLTSRKASSSPLSFVPTKTYLPTPERSTSPSSSATHCSTTRAIRHSRCEIFQSGETGQGVRATRSLTAGSMILNEVPFIRFTHPITPTSIARELNCLTEDQNALFLTFKDTVPGVEDRCARIAETNAIPLVQPDTLADDRKGDESEEETDGDSDVEIVQERNISGMFETICRVNHSCEPNATWMWNKAFQRLELRAIRDIAAYSEVTASYLDDLMKSRFERQSELLDRFGFSCICTACSRSVESISASNDNIARFGDLRARIDSIMYRIEPRTSRERSSDLGTARRHIKEVLQIAEMEKKVEAKGDLYMHLFALMAGNGDWMSAEHAAAEALKHYTKTIGREATSRTKLEIWRTSPDLSPHWKSWLKMGGQERERVRRLLIEPKGDDVQHDSEGEERETEAYLQRYQAEESDDDYTEEN